MHTATFHAGAGTGAANPSMRHTETWTKITVTIEDRHVAYLDVVIVLMRLRHHKVVPRSEIIGALVDVMERCETDFTRFATVDEIVEHLTEQFQGIPSGGRLPLLLESSLFNPKLAAEGERPPEPAGKS
jgi:hypothetical protein